MERAPGTGRLVGLICWIWVARVAAGMGRLGVGRRREGAGCRIGGGEATEAGRWLTKLVWIRLDGVSDISSSRARLREGSGSAPMGEMAADVTCGARTGVIFLGVFCGWL